MPPSVGSFAILIGTLAVLFNFSLHKIDEGYVGVYYRVRTSLLDYKSIWYFKIMFREVHY